MNKASHPPPRSRKNAATAKPLPGRRARTVAAVRPGRRPTIRVVADATRTRSGAHLEVIESLYYSPPS